MRPDPTAENKILQAAWEVFLEKGFSGARMQEIADRAGINKALLHYYFRNKQTLFGAVFETSAGKFFPRMREILNSDEPLIQKIESFIDSYLEMLIQNPKVPGFIISEMNRNPDMIAAFILVHDNRPDPGKFFLQVQEESAAGRIRPIHPAHLMLNIMSACIFPFIGKTMFRTITGITESAYDEILRERKSEVSRLILHSLKP
jgi:AcrR family transcriptional regulator